MAKQRLSFTEAWDFVKSKRRIIFPNRGFLKQLRVFEACEYDIQNPDMLMGVHVEGESSVGKDGIYKKAYLEWKEGSLAEFMEHWKEVGKGPPRATPVVRRREGASRDIDHNKDQGTEVDEDQEKSHMKMELLAAIERTGQRRQQRMG